MTRPRVTTILLIIVLILAAVTRIGWPGLTEFKYDEAIILRHAMRLVREGVPPPVLTSSVANLPHPPLMAYIMALPLLIVRDPAFVVMFFGAMGVAAVWLTYRLGARYWNAHVGLIAAAMFAAFSCSNSTWNRRITIFSNGATPTIAPSPRLDLSGVGFGSRTSAKRLVRPRPARRLASPGLALQFA